MEQLSFFVTFEGIDGCGKSTQAGLLEAALKNRGYRVKHTFEPGGTELGQKLRPILLTQDGLPLSPFAELLLFSADRRQDIDEIIQPSLKRGEIVIGERFADSSIAYQGIGGGLGKKRVERLMNVITSGLCPDLTFLLDIDPAVSLARKTKLDRIEQRGAFLDTVRSAFLEMAKSQKDRFVLINAAQPQSNIAETVLKIALERLSQRRCYHG